MKDDNDKKPMSTGKKWAVLVAMAVVFGLIAGSIMYGVNAAGNRIQAANNIEETETVSDNTASDSENSSDGESTAVEEVTKNAMPSVVTISTMSVEEMRNFFGGTQKGDVITELDGRSIGNMEQLQDVLQYYASGETVKVTAQRSQGGSYQEQEISVTLGAAADAQK